MTEKAIMRDIALAATKAGSRLFRNNVGEAWLGRTVRITRPTVLTLQPGDVVIKNATRVHYGLCIGSADLIGWTPTPRGAIFTAVEVKSDTGTPTIEQKSFLEQVSADGGIACLARTVDEAIAALKK